MPMGGYSPLAPPGYATKLAYVSGMKQESSRGYTKREGEASKNETFLNETWYSEAKETFFL